MFEMTPMMLVHVTLGGVAIISGFMALFFKKGQLAHRIAGRVFVFSMIVMALVGSYIAYLKPEMITFLAGLLTSYLVISAMVTIRDCATLSRWQGIVLALYSFAIGVAGIYYGYHAVQSANGLFDGFPAGAYFFFGGLALLAAALDFKILVQGNIAGVHRIARHTWRMMFALFIATSSLFDGPGAKLFPEQLGASGVLLIPQMVVMSLLVFWLIRILYFKKNIVIFFVLCSLFFVLCSLFFVGE